MADQEETSTASAADTNLEPDAAERSDLPPLREFNAFARFDDPDRARELILTLERSGIDGRHISAVELSPRSDGARDGGMAPEREEAMEEDVAMVHELSVEGTKGGAIGAVIGAIGGTAVALAIPGVGAAIGAGILAVAGGGAVAGAGVGAFAGAVSHTPASRSWQRALVDVDHGEIVVGLHSDQRDIFDRGVEIMSDASPRTLRRLDNDGEPLES
jgi:hypothetical protein